MMRTIYACVFITLMCHKVLWSMTLDPNIHLTDCKSIVLKLHKAVPLDLVIKLSENPEKFNSLINAQPDHTLFPAAYIVQNKNDLVLPRSSSDPLPFADKSLATGSINRMNSMPLQESNLKQINGKQTVVGYRNNSISFLTLPVKTLYKIIDYLDARGLSALLGVNSYYYSQGWNYLLDRSKISMTHYLVVRHYLINAVDELSKTSKPCCVNGRIVFDAQKKYGWEYYSKKCKIQEIAEAYFFSPAIHNAVKGHFYIIAKLFGADCWGYEKALNDPKFMSEYDLNYTFMKGVCEECSLLSAWADNSLDNSLEFLVGVPLGLRPEMELRIAHIFWVAAQVRREQNEESESINSRVKEIGALFKLPISPKLKSQDVSIPTRHFVKRLEKSVHDAALVYAIRFMTGPLIHGINWQEIYNSTLLEKLRKIKMPKNILQEWAYDAHCTGNIYKSSVIRELDPAVWEGKSPEDWVRDYQRARMGRA